MKIGILGLGSIGIRHAKNLIAMGHEVSGYDPNELSMTSIRAIRGMNVSRDEIWDQKAVIIASPSSQHLTDLSDAAVENVHCFVEKPIATENPQDVLGRIMNFEDQNKILMVGFNLRLHSCVKKAKEWLDAGRIGTPLWANFTLGQYSEKKPYLRDGVILNWSHELDLALYLLGPAICTASSTRLTDGKDDMTDILLTHESGCRSSVHLDYLTKPEIREFTITGDKGFIQAYLVTRRAYLTDQSQDWSFRGDDTWNDNYIEEMQAFLDRIDGKETIGCTGAEGLEVLKICLEVRKQAGL